MIVIGRRDRVRRSGGAWVLLPFLRPGDPEAAAAADVIVTFWGTPRRLAGTTWIHQCGSVEGAKAAAAAAIIAPRLRRRSP